MDKTLEFNINGAKVMVDDLPKPIRDMVVLFDRMREDLADLSYQQNVLLIAVSAINSKIIVEAQEFIDGPKDSDENAEPVSNVSNINGEESDEPE